jgi:tripartite-type tricarboxylate transporter receptor subunit TctC
MGGSNGRHSYFFKRVIFLIFGLVLGGMGLNASSQDFPTRPVKIVVPYGAGGTIDLMARLLAPALSAKLGQPVIIENKPGAGTVIGAESVARAEPDGYTLLLGSNAAFTISPQLMEKVTYDPLKSFAAIGTISAFPNLILVKPDSPFQSLGDVVMAARQAPGKLSYASFGAGSTAQLSAEGIKTEAKLEITHIPYKSGAQSTQAILSGDVSFGFDTVLGSAQRVKSGQLRALAVTSQARWPDLPEVRTVAEQGLPAGVVTAWVAMFAPAGIAQPIQNKLSVVLQQVIADPDIKAKFANLGVSAEFTGPIETMQMVRLEYKKFGDLIKAANIRMD